MVKFSGVSKIDMTPYLETAVLIAYDLCVTQQKGTNVKKNPLNYFTYKIKYHMYNQLSI